MVKNPSSENPHLHPFEVIVVVDEVTLQELQQLLRDVLMFVVHFSAHVVMFCSAACDLSF